LIDAAETRIVQWVPSVLHNFDLHTGQCPNKVAVYIMGEVQVSNERL
jgi:hypothetical protein